MTDEIKQLTHHLIAREISLSASLVDPQDWRLSVMLHASTPTTQAVISTAVRVGGHLTERTGQPNATHGQNDNSEGCT